MLICKRLRSTSASASITSVALPRAEGTFYDEERYDRLQPRQEAQQRKRAVKALERLSYQVTLERVA
jgi:hypothetical protein